MMESLRSATRNTGFERWLDATLRPQPSGRRARPARRSTRPRCSRSVPYPCSPRLQLYPMLNG